MDKEYIVSKVEKIINGEELSLDIDYNFGKSSKESFYLNTVKRLFIAMELYRKNTSFKNDYLLALRDYLLVFDVSTRLSNNELVKDNRFGISLDEVENMYFASYQLPQDINEKFVKDAFLRGENNNKSNIEEEKLITNPMIYHLTGYSKFKSLDQKIAVYGALNTPDGYTSLVSLPTGGGKSLVTQTISYQKEGLTIVVVPTVSLAIDQERVTKSVIKRDYNENEIFAYSSGVKAGPILKAIKEKKARVLFISPEALLENPGFAETIKEANKSRYLKNIVIDEAHIVVDWGAAFRVDYQCLEAWRNMLLMSNPTLRTILLSATFEDHCVDILRNFFEVNGKWIEIRCDALRHEPRYCIIRNRSNAEKQNKIIELVRKLPHPMIIYVARPFEAGLIKNDLAKVGIYNVKTFTGLTSSSQRKELIDAWVENRFEIMVATSAFGVGVDKPDVRTVIHTYIPQNANTYYQELGRGGRDHLPCLSVMCLQPEDSTIGRDRITKKVLTPEKIIGRWDSLYNNIKSQRMTDNRVFIDTSIKPNYADIDVFDDSPTSEADMNWNVYVLLFLRRYNMIQILEVKAEKGKYIVLIKIIDDRLLVNDEKLQTHIETLREMEWKYYKDSYNAMSNAVSPNSRKCISELFTDTYSKVFEYCAGCNAHDEIVIGDVPKFPLKNKVSMPLKSLTDEQKALFGDSDEILIISKESELNKLIEKLIIKGVSMIVIPDKYNYESELLEHEFKKNVMIFSVEELYQLIKLKAFYFTSGFVAIIYPKDELDLAQQYVVIKNYLCGKESTKVIHITYSDAYISQAGKNITELVDGPSIKANVVFS
jgi:ATP-dependent DNA helicase RecQ